MMKRLLLITLLLIGCDRIPEGIKKPFLAPAPPTPQTVDLICDFGGGSSGCTADSMTSLLREITPTLPAGSVVRLHGMADAVADGRQLSEYQITAPKKKTLKAVSDHRKRQTDAIIKQFETAAKPLFLRDDRRRSPIAETIGRALLAGANGERHLYLLTDAREVSKNATLGKRANENEGFAGLDYECGRILSGDDFAERLGRLYPPDSLRGVNVHFVHVQLEPVANNRCTATVERYTQLKNTWTEALQAHGATVTWSMN